MMAGASFWREACAQTPPWPRSPIHDRESSIKRASGLIISITGRKDLSLFESTKLPPAFAKRQTRYANIIIGRLSMNVWKVSYASRWWRPASIIPIRRARRNQREKLTHRTRRQAEQRQPSRRRRIKVMHLVAIRESAGPPAARYPKGDRKPEFDMRTMRLRWALIRTAAPREICK